MLIKLSSCRDKRQGQVVRWLQDGACKAKMSALRMAKGETQWERAFVATLRVESSLICDHLFSPFFCYYYFLDFFIIVSKRGQLFGLVPAQYDCILLFFQKINKGQLFGLMPTQNE
ncbi:hypothetical protein E2542_SST31058 [Spatholobus suberectus]|nr:hypothetical protein E2542_SST31058 [Spatholobus suberectus]